MKWVCKVFVGVDENKDLFLTRDFTDKKQAETWVYIVDNTMKNRGHNPALYDIKIEEVPD